MAGPDDTFSDDKKEAIPAFKFSPKKVDDGWKEEARKEREAAAAARAEAAAKAAAQKAAAEKEAVAAAAEVTAPAPEEAPSDGSGAATGEAPEITDAPPARQQSPAEMAQTKIFMNFIDGLAQQALMQLGELENPYTGQAEMDIQGAQYTIQLLAVILAKTKGNLSDVEHKALTGVLTDLKKHFAVIAQELQRQMAAQAAQKGAMRPGPGGTLR
ncbi:MAG: DUF1844 domain-containing protein [Planctomycetota bacterium]